MHRGFCFLVCNPEAGWQSFFEFNRFIEFNRCRNTAAGIDDLTSVIVNTCDIVITGGIVNARPGHPSHQFG